MEEITITLPKLGESIVSATITKWYKKEGDWVEKDEAILEVATDKLASEIPSVASGVLKKILAQENQELSVGDPLAIISVQEKTQESAQEEKVIAPPQESPKEESEDFLSPAVRQIVKEHGLTEKELQKIPREKKRLSKQDIQKYLDAQNAGSEKIPMTPMRKTIAQNMERSYREIPHATLVTEIDVTDLLAHIAHTKEDFFQKHQVKISLTTYLSYALCQVATQFPLINASVEKETIIAYKDVHLGIAVNIENGLVVPVIKAAQKHDPVELAKTIYAIAKKAREGNLSLEEMQGGTITITNFGMSGISMGFPIIRFPEAAILGIGAIVQKPVIFENAITPRSIMTVSLTFDHRIIDGMYGCNVLNQYKKLVEEYGKNPV